MNPQSIPLPGFVVTCAQIAGQAAGIDHILKLRHSVIGILAPAF